MFWILLSFVINAAPSHAQYVWLEGGSTQQTRNDQRVPGDGGSRFSISDFNKGPFTTARLYVGHRWNQRHELRALYAPLTIKVDGRFSDTVNFNSQSFAANTDTQLNYKFNSYRLTYAYHFASSGAWDWAVGFTAKVRDAEVRVSQGGLMQRKANVGFVPLLNLQAVRDLGGAWRFRFDLDGLAAPQGRAFDVALLFEHELVDGVHTLVGYRTVEGGADNKEVYNFAWFHTAVLGLRGEF